MGEPTARSQTELDRVVYLIVGVVVFLLVVPAVMSVAGIDIRDGSLTPGNETSQTEGVRILSAFATDINEDRSSLGTVELIVTTGEGSSVDLSQATVSWNGDQEYDLTPRGVDVGDGSFAINGSTVIEGTGDRAILRFDLGTEDVPGVDRFGERLKPGDTVYVSIVTEDGVRTTRELTVPDPLPPGAGVSLF